MAVERRYDVLTFDCYGTLVDWEAGIGAAFVRAGAAAGVEVDPAAAVAAHAAIEPGVEAGPYRPYREVLAETACRVAARLGWTLEREQAKFLPESLPDWPPFPDTVPALRRLQKAGYRLGILSNVDDDLLAATRRALEVPFDPVVTAQQVRSYKPGHDHFLEARRRIGGARWLHAAQSRFHDVAPARELGIPVVWVNRQREAAEDGPVPDRELASLAELAEWLA